MSKNVIWEFFKKLGTEPGKAQCNECCKLLSLGSNKRRNQTLSGLKGHLTSCHRDDNSIYMLKAKDDESKKAAKKMKVDYIANKQVRIFVQTLLKTVTEKGFA